MLTFDGALFAQLVEGPGDAIAQLQKNLTKDSMHREMLTHFFGKTDGRRRYPGWRMGFLNVKEHGTLDDIKGASDREGLQRFDQIAGNLDVGNGQAYPSLT